jgi:hypothetical protein
MASNSKIEKLMIFVISFLVMFLKAMPLLEDVYIMNEMEGDLFDMESGEILDSLVFRREGDSEMGMVDPNDPALQSMMGTHDIQDLTTNENVMNLTTNEPTNMNLTSMDEPTNMNLTGTNEPINMNLTTNEPINMTATHTGTTWEKVIPIAETADEPFPLFVPVNEKEKTTPSFTHPSNEEPPVQNEIVFLPSNEEPPAVSQIIPNQPPVITQNQPNMTPPPLVANQISAQTPHQPPAVHQIERNPPVLAQIQGQNSQDRPMTFQQ